MSRDPEEERFARGDVAGRTILARHIIAAAKAGDRDPRLLADSALLYLAQQKVSRTPPEDLS